MAVLNIAHRGGAALMPENTLAAFADARMRGADGAELDVQLSRDGVAVVHHDYRLNPGYCRRPDGKWLREPALRIKDLTLAELRTFDVGRADPASDYARAHPLLQPVDGARIPTLQEAIETARVSSSFILFIELKSDPRHPELSADTLALADIALAVVRQENFLDRSIFVGFDWPGLVRVKQQAPNSRCWFSTMAFKGLPRRALFDAIGQDGCDGWFPDFEDASSEAIADAHARGLRIGAWTVDDPADMKRLLAGGIDAICTNRPDLMARIG
jgi:glycerophosphoryl diester phosphodiesterase